VVALFALRLHAHQPAKKPVPFQTSAAASAGVGGTTLFGVINSAMICGSIRDN
jgi:hypothetical protein